MRHFAVKAGGSRVVFTKEALYALAGYFWPGNVRGLENAITRILILRRGDVIGSEDLPERILSQRKPAGPAPVINLPPEGYSLEQLERSNWNKSAAAFLRIPRHVLLYRLEKYGINGPSK